MSCHDGRHCAVERLAGWQSLIGAELIVASSGIGYLMMKGQSTTSTSIGVVIDVALRALQARIERHRQ